MTAGVAEEINKNDTFNQFVMDSINRHLSGDWGELCEEDAEVNRCDPLNAMSVYTSPDGVKIWVKQDYDILTVLFPSEY